MRDTSLVAPIRNHAFFEQPQFQRLFGYNLLQIAGRAPKILHIAGVGFTCRVAGQPRSSDSLIAIRR